jgi:hypothetical protein
MSDDDTDRYAVVCNYTDGTKMVRTGAKAYIDPAYLGGNLPERAHLRVLSRGGRWIEKWENMRRLGNFRVQTLPAEHPMYDRGVTVSTRERAEEAVAYLARATQQLGQTGCDVGHSNVPPRP